MKIPSLLLHTCCAPCISHVYEELSPDYNVTSFFFNPNISPREEYDRRLSELKAYSELRGFPLIEGNYLIREWTAGVKKYRFLGERSPRCHECYRIRLEESFKKAKEINCNAVTTTLTISPHKDAHVLNRIGKELEGKYGIEFLARDFKKRDGYKKSVELSKKYGFYRQNYCGCIYSKLEREDDPRWMEQVRRARDILLTQNKENALLEKS